jgi:putative nucleotidyltransferase with HDIG domain
LDLLPFLTHIISLQDPHAQAHSDHVNDLAVMLSRRVDLSSRQLEKVRFAAAIHDIGKIAINDFIVTKPGKFTEAEYMLIQQHAVLGARMLEKLDLDPDIRTMVVQHHENFDGSGYPYNLSGEQISVGARIIRVTDTYDALTSHRGYRPAYSPQKAITIMELEEKFFDPELLEAFFKMRPGKRTVI